MDGIWKFSLVKKIYFGKNTEISFIFNLLKLFSLTNYKNNFDSLN